MRDNVDPWLQNSSSFDNALARLAHLGKGTTPPPAAEQPTTATGFVKSSEEYSTTSTTPGTSSRAIMYVFQPFNASPHLRRVY